MTVTAGTAVGPYSPIRQAGNWYFISGCIGLNSGSQTASEDIMAQTIQALANLKTVLETAGLTFSNVVKTTIFLTDMSDFATVNTIYAQHFTPPYPARSAVAVAELPRVANTALKIEIEAVAIAQTPSSTA